MKFAGSLMLLGVIAASAQADITDEYHGNIGAYYETTKLDGVSADTQQVDLRFYPKGVDLRPGKLAYEVDQINGSSYLHASFSQVVSRDEGVEIDTEVTRLGGELVLLNRELFLGFNHYSRTPETNIDEYQIEDDGSLELSVGVRTGQLLTRLTRSSFSTEGTYFLGASTPFFPNFVTYENYGVTEVDSESTTLGFSWVDRTDGGNLVVLYLDIFHQRVTEISEIREYQQQVNNPAVDEELAGDPALTSVIEVSDEVKTWLGGQFSASYFPRPDISLTATFRRSPGQSPIIATSARLLINDRFVVSPGVFKGKDSQGMRLAASMRI